MDPTKTSITLEEFDALDMGEKDPKFRVEAVVASTDTSFNYYKQAYGSLAI